MRQRRGGFKAKPYSWKKWFSSYSHWAATLSLSSPTVLTGHRNLQKISVRFLLKKAVCPALWTLRQLGRITRPMMTCFAIIIRITCPAL
jgi:hypothetical protein